MSTESDVLFDVQTPAAVDALGAAAGTDAGPVAGEPATPMAGQVAGPAPTGQARLLLDFCVFGRPAQQGSKSATMRGGRPVIFEDNKRTEPWRQAVVSAARDAMPNGWTRIARPKPVGISILFTFDVPTSAPKRRCYWQTTRTSGDADKLLRSTFDGLTAAGVWEDDAQVVRLFEPFGKVSVGDPDAMTVPGAHIRIYLLGDE